MGKSYFKTSDKVSGIPKQAVNMIQAASLSSKSVSGSNSIED